MADPPGLNLKKKKSKTRGIKVMEGKISEFTSRRVCIFPKDIGTADQTGVYFDAKGHTKFCAHLQTSALTSTQTCFVELMQAKAGGTDGKVLGTRTTHTAPVAGSNGDIVAEADIDELDSANGFCEVSARAGSGTNSVLGSVVLLMKPDSLPAE